jgi:hypothetical protein
MFVWKKKYDAVTREMGRQIVERDDTLMVREATIGRLQRSGEDMLARNLELQAVSKGILRDKLAESQRANLAEQRVNSLLDEIAALRPDAEKYRERCRRDREHAENARVRKRAARKEAA